MNSLPAPTIRRRASVVALGGGHGLSATLSAVRRVVDDVTAIVTVADDGGSSGRLRDQFDVLPPGDLRMALAALCGDDDWGQTWAEVFQHRFAGEGELAGHVVGNLLIVGLWEEMGDPVAGLELVGRLLRAEGRVLPMSESPVRISASVSGLDTDRPDAVSVVEGQAAVAVTPGRIQALELSPDPVQACPDAVDAIRAADWILLGPGSWYTSVLPHLMVPGLREAIVERSDRLIVVLNLDPGTGETSDLDPEDYLSVLTSVAPELRVHTVVADPTSVPAPERLSRAVSQLGGALRLSEVAVPGSKIHSHVALAGVLAAIFDELAFPACEPPSVRTPNGAGR